MDSFVPLLNSTALPWSIAGNQKCARGGEEARILTLALPAAFLEFSPAAFFGMLDKYTGIVVKEWIVSSCKNVYGLKYGSTYIFELIDKLSATYGCLRSLPGSDHPLTHTHAYMTLLCNHSNVVYLYGFISYR